MILRVYNLHSQPNCFWKLFPCVCVCVCVYPSTIQIIMRCNLLYYDNIFLLLSLIVFSLCLAALIYDHKIIKYCYMIRKLRLQTSLEVQWLRIHLPMQRKQVQSLVRDNSTCHKAIKPMHHSYLSPCSLEPTLDNKRSPTQSEAHSHHKYRVASAHHN